MLIPKLPREPNLSPVRFLYGIWQNLLGNTSLKLPDLPTNDPNISPTSLLNAIWKATQNGGGGGGLPSQSGHAGEFLTTDGTTPSWVPSTGGGDMLGSNNLSDLTNIATARVNLGGTGTGIALFTAANAAAARAAIAAGTSSFSGAYADLTGKPTLGTAAALNTGYSSGSVVKLVDSPSNPPNPAIRLDADGGRVFYLAGNNSPGVGSFELTLPVSNGTLVSTGDTGSVTNAMLENSSITINGTPVSLGGSTTISTGLTVNTTTVSGASANDLLISDGTKLQKITPGTGVATALGNAVNGASGLLTYGLIGTSGTKIPLLDGVNTWSANQVVNATLSALNVTSTNNVTATNFVFSSASGAITWGGESQVQRYGTASWKWNYDQNAANPTDVIHKSASGITGTDRNGADFIIESGDSTGTGTSDIIFKTPTAGSTGTTARVAAEKFRVNSTAVTASVPVKLPSYTVSGLPTASTVGAGSMAFVTDATSTTTYTTVSGGGANKVLVISDGTNWIIH